MFKEAIIRSMVFCIGNDPEKKNKVILQVFSWADVFSKEELQATVDIFTTLKQS